MLRVIFEVLTLICDVLVINDWPVKILDQNIEFRPFFVFVYRDKLTFVYIISFFFCITVFQLNLL